MDINELTALFADSMFLVIMMVSALVTPGLILGLIVAVFQAATQVNEQTLSFFAETYHYLADGAIFRPLAHTTAK